MAYKIITIGRQTGSGGHEIAELLSERLNIPLHDRNVVEEAVKGLNIENIDEVDEKLNVDYLAKFAKGFHAIYGKGKLYHMMDVTPDDGTEKNEKLFQAQAKVIKNLADMGPCIIIGRGADSVLRGRKDVLNVFICAEEENRIKRMMIRRNLTHERAANAIDLTDRDRAKYYKACTDRTWGVPDNYDVTLSSSNLGIEGVVDVLEKLYKA